MEFFTGKGEIQRNSSGAKPIFFSDFSGANGDCTEFSRVITLLVKFLRGKPISHGSL